MAEMNNMARQAPDTAGKSMPKEDSKAGSLSITPASMREKMKLPPNMQQPYERVVLAAKKIMYSEQMKPQMMELLKGPGTVGSKIGQGVVALMALLVSHSNNTIPPQLILPAATELVAEAGDFLRKVGMKVTDHDLAEGMAYMVGEILGRAGVTPDKIPDLLKQQGQPAAAPQGA